MHYFQWVFKNVCDQRETIKHKNTNFFDGEQTKLNNILGRNNTFSKSLFQYQTVLYLSLVLLMGRRPLCQRRD